MAKTKLPPKDWLHPKIRQYWKLGYTDTRIAGEISKDIQNDPELSGKAYSISCTGIFRSRRTMDLLGTRQRAKAGLADDFRPIAERIKKEHPKIGARAMVAFLVREHNIKVTEQRVLEYFQELRGNDNKQP
ncbi:hypothetical protein C8F01DRAFT_383140 [Mycena amicta]|nr:hypothetical protein C8F01DRAFT_383140 [Mycena amicta]